MRAKPQGNAITVSHSQELAPRKIRVNALNPGMIETEGLRASGLHKGEFREQQEKTTPLGRSATPDDIALAATLLVGDDARWVTGDRVFLDLSSRATTPDVPGLGAVRPRPMTHVEALDLDPLPAQVIVLGEGMWTLNSRLRFLTGRCSASSRSSCCAATESHGYSPARGRNRLIRALCNWPHRLIGRPVDPRALMLSCIAKSLWRNDRALRRVP
jgi:hypothetical protein